MTKEDLIKYKEKLSKLSEKEKKLRDLHLDIQALINHGLSIIQN